jgi:hypothetical protein
LETVRPGREVAERYAAPPGGLAQAKESVSRATAASWLGGTKVVAVPETEAFKVHLTLSRKEL